jgi:hypothetical protein
MSPTTAEWWDIRIIYAQELCGTQTIMIMKITSKRSLWCLVNVSQWRSAPSASTEYWGPSTTGSPVASARRGTYGLAILWLPARLRCFASILSGQIRSSKLAVAQITTSCCPACAAKPLIFCIFIFHFASLRSMRARVLGMYYVLMISRSNGMDARIAGQMSSCTTARPTALGYVPFARALHASPTRVKNAHAHARTHGHCPRTQINRVCVARGESCILRDEKSSSSARRCSSKCRSKTTSSSTDLAPKELTGVYAHDDMAHELGRGTFATVIRRWRAPRAVGGPSRSSTRRSSTRRTTITKTTSADATDFAALLPPCRISRDRSIF